MLLEFIKKLFTKSYEKCQCSAKMKSTTNLTKEINFVKKKSLQKVIKFVLTPLNKRALTYDF